MIYYIIGFGIAYLVSLIPGVAYGHGPGLHHIIGFLILAGGVIWAVYSLVRIIHNKNDRMNLASLILNVIVIAGVLLYLTIIINKESNESITPQKENIITVNYDSSTKKSSAVNGLGDTIMLKVRDSVIIDKLNEESKQRNYR